jgi:hypothetical protein
MAPLSTLLMEAFIKELVKQVITNMPRWGEQFYHRLLHSSFILYTILALGSILMRMAKTKRSRFNTQYVIQLSIANYYIMQRK